MAKLPKSCPSCESILNVSELTCQACDTRVLGNYEVPSLLRLSEDDQHFVLEFVKVGGSLKEMAKQLQKSYPTVRNMLDDIIKKLNREINDV